MTALVTENLPLLAGAPNGVQQLRTLILELAVRGKLAENAPSSESVDELLKRIAVEKSSEGTHVKANERAIVDDDNIGTTFSLPSGWRWVRFGSIARHNSGKTLDKGRNSGVPRDYITTSNLYWGRFELSNVRQMLIREEELERCTARRGDLLICEGGEAGRAAVWGHDHEICFQNHVHRARLMGGINPQFAYRVFERLNASGEINLFRKGVGISNMSGKSLASIPFPLPPIEDQNRIVAKVDELMALCDRLEAQQADADAAHEHLVQALLASLTQARDAADFRASWQQLAEHFHTLFTTEASIETLKLTVIHLAVMGKLVNPVEGEATATDFLAAIDAARLDVEATPSARTRQRSGQTELMPEPPYQAPSGWRWRNLGSLLSISGGVTLGRKLIGRQLVTLPYLRVANVQRGFLDLNQVKEVEVPIDEVEKYKLVPDDLLTTEGGDWDKVGRTAIWRDEIEQCLHQNHIFRSRPYIKDFNSRWVELYLNSVPAREYFASSSKQTTNLASINMTQLRACAFPVPPLAEQHRIVAKVDELIALCNELKLALAIAREHHEHLATVLVEQAEGPLAAADVETA